MMILDPFRRAVVLALAWCLIGLGVDPGPQGNAVPAQPAANARRTAWVPHQFASQRAAEGHPAARPTTRP